MHAVIKTGGKQYRVEPGDEFNIEKLPDAQDGESVVFDEVLAVGSGEDLVVGTPTVDDASVKADVVVAEGKGKKVMVFKKKRRKRYQRKRSHRQPFTRIKITDVDIE